MNDIQFLYYEKKNISNVKLYQIFILVYFPTNEREGKYLKLLYTTCFVYLLYVIILGAENMQNWVKRVQKISKYVRVSVVLNNLMNSFIPHACIMTNFAIFAH